MKVSDVISRLKVMLADSTEEVVETKVEEKMAEATLVDGTEVYTEGELEPGAILFVRAGEGVSEDPFAPAGIHETTDGLIITVGENGEISSIEEKSAEAAQDEIVEEEMAEHDKEKEEMNIEELLKAIVEMLLPYTEGMEEVKEKIEVLENRFNKIADEPAATRITNNFKAEFADSKSTAERRFERLVELRKSGQKIR